MSDKQKQCLERLSTLIGRWKGEGKGTYPTIEPFEYGEESTFERHRNKPVFHFTQKTWNKYSAEYMHWESGFIIVKEDGSIEFSNSQGGGRTEVLLGSLREEKDGGFVMNFQSKVLSNDDKLVKTAREFVIDGDQLTYVVSMSTHTTPELQKHLEATLKKVS